MSNPNTGRPPMPHDAEITEADKLVDQGVGSYFEIRQRLGHEALGMDVSTPTDLFDFYGPEFNPKHGEVGGAWLHPTPEEKASQEVFLGRIRADHAARKQN